MNLHQFALSAVVLTTLILGSAAPARAETTIYRMRGNTAFATWVQYGDCSFSDITISVTEGVTRLTGSQTAETVIVNVRGDIYDMCYGSPNYGTQVTYTGVSQAETVVDFASAALNSAALKVTFPIHVYGSRGVYEGSMIIDLSWVGTNAYISTGTSSSRQVAPDGIYTQRQTGVQRSATVTGTVLLDGVSVTNGESFAEVSRATEGTLTILR